MQNDPDYLELQHLISIGDVKYNERKSEVDQYCCSKCEPGIDWGYSYKCGQGPLIRRCMDKGYRIKGVVDVVEQN